MLAAMVQLQSVRLDGVVPETLARHTNQSCMCSFIGKKKPQIASDWVCFEFLNSHHLFEL